MAITNAQQFKQLVNPPMEGKKRPGYRGDAAAAAAATRDNMGGRADPGSRGSVKDDFDRGSFQDAVRRGELKAEVERQEAEKREELVERFRNKQFRGSNLPGFIGMGLNLAGPLVQRGMTANRNFFLDKVLPSKNFEDIDFESLSPSKQDQLYSDYMSARLSGEIDAFGNPLNQGDDSPPPLFPRSGIMAQAPSNMDQEPEAEKLEGLRLAFRADGGPIGGEYDFESARQMYGLGKLVKKVTKTVKKIVKSPIGKAALIGGGGYLLGGGIIPGVSGKIIPFAKYGSSAGSGFGFGNILPNILNIAKMPGLAEKAFSMGTTGKALTGILGASILPLIFGKKQDDNEFDIDAYYAANRLNLNAPLNRRILGTDFYGGQTAADGGRIGYQEGGDAEPVAKKTMPLLDMGGKEKDYRETGGFVDMGRMERADDVPARLSKNEFVFTADAVRNAGDGDIDKGAEVMYNMMKNLEAGGEVSEESQGLEGARRMFQTSQRLEEVL